VLVYKLLISKRGLNLLENLPEKSERVVRGKLRLLAESPYPMRGEGDKEKIRFHDYEIYRIHIGRSFTAFYRIYEVEKTVRILDLMTIGEAHKRYGKL
jgi:hypothetical protein